MAVEQLLLLSRLLSYSVITMSTCIKLPQVWKMYSAGSSKGISTRGYWLEIISYLVGISYGLFYEHHFTMYLDKVILAIQSSVIVALSIIYSRHWNLENGVCLTIAILFVVTSILKIVPNIILDTLLVLGIPLSSSSKLLQINGLYRMKRSGDVSLITWVLTTYGCVARVFTTLVELSDITMLAGFMIKLTLNIIIVVQILYYGNNQKKTD